MKKDLHPPYQEVLFVDTSTGYRFVCGSTLKTDQKEMFEGKEYPVCYVTVSSSSHPFFTGSKQFVDAEGRVDKFIKRYAKKNQEQKQQQQPEEKETKAQAKKPVKKKK